MALQQALREAAGRDLQKIKKKACMPIEQIHSVLPFTLEHVRADPAQGPLGGAPGGGASNRPSGGPPAATS